MPRSLDEAVRRQRERRARAERDSRRSIGRDLAQVGVLGWTIVLTTLIGIYAGRWLDHRLGTGIACTLALLFAGVTLGCVLAWQRLNRS
ncbi:MAG TPA: AtpZ/AtpI family protein [Steroidobacteraceae bacterium]|nr:AtpZ/AtpI family protein [Steroidobacteraceae bacterium]